MYPQEIMALLRGETPHQWLQQAQEQIPLLLVDHAHCEKKAASTAIGLIYRYPDKMELLRKMAKVAREELLHFEQVLKLLQQRSISFENISPCEYAKNLHQKARAHEPAKLIDTLIIGALIEARSCERFQKLAEIVDSDLAKFYRKLYIAEARHFSDYLKLARCYADQNIDDRINFFAELEYELINTEDAVFRFHSGVPLYSTISCSEQISNNSDPSLIESPTA